MKNSIRILALSLAAATVAFPAPFLAVGDGAELFLTGTLGVRSDDNIFMAANKVDDVIFDINPGVALTFGKGSLNQGNLSFTESFARYSQNDDLNTELAALRFNSSYDDGKSKFKSNASYVETNQNSVDVRGTTLVRRNATDLGATAELSATAKSKVGVGLAYSDTDYKTTGYSDLTTFTIPVNYYYAVTPKVDLSFGYRYRNSEVQGGVDSKDNAFRVGARGDFSPKVTGSVSVGYGARKLDVGGTKDLIDLDAMLNVELSPKTSLQLTASNDFGVSGQGQQQKNLSFGGLLTGKVSDQISLRGGLNYRAIDYYTRTDDYLEGQLGVDYVISNNVTIQGAYAYRKNKSDLASSSFNNSVFSLAAQFRY